MSPNHPSRNQWRSSRQVLVWLFGLGVLLVLGLILMAVAPAAKAGSSYDRSPWGSYQFFQYLQHLQEQVPSQTAIQRWQRDYKRLDGTGQVLLQISSQRRWQQPQSLPPEMEKWIQAGNTLIRLNWGGAIKSPQASQRLQTSQGPVVIETRRRMDLTLELSRPGEGQAMAVLADAEGAVIWSTRSKMGTRVYGVYPWFVANANANANNQNFAYFAALAQNYGNKIWFDEWLHGYRIREAVDALDSRAYGSLWDYLRRTPWLLVLLQAVVLVLVLLWGKNHRLGPLLRSRSNQQANSEQYILALSGVLQQAQHHDFVQAQLSQRLRQELAEKLGLRGAWSGHETELKDLQLAQAWSSQTGESPTELLLVLGSTPPQLSESELLAWMSRVEALQRTL